ncbi:MAG: DsbA family oxidoreductase [Acidimicrobiaceae bacterium]|nr:DsbA family oxidoreductase [Acidimicrobiaceae bacterium]
MASEIFVDVWSDVVCPFCYLGFRQFHDALEQFENAASVVVRHHAFELDLDAPHAYPGTLNELLAVKYSMPLERASALNERVNDSACQMGMAWSLETARPTNTFDAHRVIAHAATQGRQGEMLERLFRAYFSEGHLLSDPQTLSMLALEIGVVGTDNILSSNQFTEEVRHDEHLATKAGITGVPTLIFDGALRVSGAQGSDAMLNALHTAWTGRCEQRA